MKNQSIRQMALCFSSSTHFNFKMFPSKWVSKFQLETSNLIIEKMKMHSPLFIIALTTSQNKRCLDRKWKKLFGVLIIHFIMESTDAALLRKWKRISGTDFYFETWVNHGSIVYSTAKVFINHTSETEVHAFVFYFLQKMLFFCNMKPLIDYK